MQCRSGGDVGLQDKKIIQINPYLDYSRNLKRFHCSIDKVWFIELFFLCPSFHGQGLSTDFVRIIFSNNCIATRGC